MVFSLYCLAVILSLQRNAALVIKQYQRAHKSPWFNELNIIHYAPKSA